MDGSREVRPYALWRHTHEFEDGPGATIIHDRVRYSIPFGPHYRREAVARELESPESSGRA
jgi:ligand-binding SRPBCC domain-containing protein